MGLNDLWAVPALAALGIALCLSLISAGYLYLSDADLHAHWAQQFLNGMHEGAFYPRWAPESNFRFGSPTFSFYPPFVFFTYAFFWLFSGETTTIMVVSAVAGLAASGLAMYALSRTLFGIRMSLLCAALYMAAPYHLIDLLQRTAMAESWAFLWPPLLLLFAGRARGSAASMAGLALCFAGLIITHLPTTVLFTPFLAVYIITRNAIRGEAKSSLRSFAALAVGAAVASFYLAPAIFEQQYVRIDSLRRGWFSVGRNFLFSSTAGEAGLNSLVSAVAVSSAVICALYLAVRRWAKREDQIFLFSSVGGLVAFVLMTKIAGPLWESTDILKKIQFPWRMLSVLTLFSTLSLAASINCLLGVAKGRLRATFWTLLVISSLFTLSLSVRVLVVSMAAPEPPPYSLRPEMPYEETIMNYRKLFPDNPRMMEGNEYRPKTAFFKEAPAFMNIPAGMQDESVLVAFQGEGTATAVEWKPERRIVSVTSASGGRLLLRTFYYPGWRAYDEAVGTEVGLGADQSSGVIALEVGPGNHSLIFRYEGTDWHRTGNVISLAALAALIGLVTAAALRGKRENHKIISGTD